MTEGGFLDTRRNSPASLAAVLLLHAAALTAVILAKGPEIADKFPILKTYMVPLKPEPPEPAPPEPKAQQPATQSRAIDTPETVMTLPVPDKIQLSARPDIDLGPTTPVIEDPIPADPPMPPVLREAVLDARVAQPPYPPAMARLEMEGKVTVRVLVGTDGRVRQVEPVNFDDPAFLEATRRHALRAWRFAPATRDGLAVESWRTMTVRFRLDA